MYCVCNPQDHIIRIGDTMHATIILNTDKYLASIGVDKRDDGFYDIIRILMFKFYCLAFS